MRFFPEFRVTCSLYSDLCTMCLRPSTSPSTVALQQTESELSRLRCPGHCNCSVFAVEESSVKEAKYHVEWGS